MKKFIVFLAIAIILTSCGGTTVGVKFRAHRMYYSASEGAYLPWTGTVILREDSSYRAGDTVRRDDGVYVLDERVK